MGLEVATTINQLVPTNPVGATDPKSQGDDHIRLLKATILATFANITGAVTATHTELNYVAGVTSGIQTQLNNKAASTHAHSAADLTSGTVPDARFPATLPAASGANLTALNATQLTTGTVPDARFPATLPAASGVNLTNLNGTNVASGTVADARLSSQVCLKDSAISGADNAAADDPGYRGIPVNDAASVRAIALTDHGRVVRVTANGGGAMSIADGTFPIGFVCTIIANGDTAFTVTNDGTMYLAGSNFGTTGTRTIARGGFATVLKILAGNWLIWGIGVS